MKLTIVVASIFLTGCSIILPKPHDPVMFDQMVGIKITLNNTKCAGDKNWDSLFDKVERLKVYTQLRQDPQAKSVDDLQVALKKAHSSANPIFCESVLKVNRVRVDTIADAWRGR
jgi:hypothetical protein